MSGKNVIALLCAGFMLGAAVAGQADAAQQSETGKGDSKQIQRGRYLAKIAGCNDCHTAGYAMSGGNVPESLWLTGDKLGWRGPWGTTYAVNLRLYMRDMTEGEWVKRAKTMKTRPPMPWFALHDMTGQDLRALYHFVKSLGPVGEPAPAYVVPDKTPQGPYIQFPAPPK
jgi:mono/diheme cytochrome c family protein